MQPQVFQIGGTEWLWILLFVAILLFGSKKIPEMARAFGKAMGEFQRGRAEIEREIRQAMEVVQAPSITPATTTASATAAPATAAKPTPAAPVVAKPPTPTQTPAAYNTEHKRLLDAAASLGIDPRGKTDEQLREEIRRAVG
jgi:sec-independent protein translocase protein TatA